MSEATSGPGFITKDSGARDQFETGARRDSRTGKGRFDLVPASVMRMIMDYRPILTSAEGVTMAACVDSAYEEAVAYAEEAEVEAMARCAYWALFGIQVEFLPTGRGWIDAQIDGRHGDGYTSIPPLGLQRLAQLYERGAAKYSDNNWKGGMPLSRTLDSLLRHLNVYMSGDRAEDHLAAVAWNAFTICWTHVAIQSGKLPTSLADL